MGGRVVIDVETRSQLDLRKVGAARYAADPSTDVWCAAYAIDDQPVQLWVRGDPVPSALVTAAADPDYVFVAHNAAFERAILRHVLQPRYGWPGIPRWRDTMAAALSLALPASLAKVAGVLALPQQKADKDIVSRMAKPRRPRGAEAPAAGPYWFDEPEYLERLYSYCKQDVETTRELYRRLPPLLPAEQALWELDQRVNDFGFYVDGKLITNAIAISTAAERAVQAELQQITSGEITSTAQVEKLVAWLAARGCVVTDLQKGTLHHALRRKDLTPEARRVIELRLEAAHASANKAQSLQAWRCLDGYIRGAFKFHGAATGRWSGAGPQPQNFRRETEDTEAKVAAVMSANIETVRQLGAPIEIVGDIARATICAPPGRRLLTGDFSGIESRVLAWIADEHSKLKLWETFDRTHSADDDPYTVIGRSLGHSDATARAKGKVADLAFGYQGGAGAYKNFAPEDDTASEAEVKAFRDAWRVRHPQIVQFWWGLDRAAVSAVHQPTRPVRYGRLSLHCERLGDALFLFITLPSGRRLSYPFPKLMTNRFNRAAVEFMDNSIVNGGWVPCNHGQGAYGGLWTENIVSAIARDLLAAAITRLEAAGYRVVLHVHDEIVCELPDKDGSLEEFKYLIERLPEWAEGLPVAAKVRNGPRFAEVDMPVVHVAGATAVPFTAKPRAARKAVADLGPPPIYPPIAEIGFDSPDPRGRMVAWALEREAIRKRKEAGQPWPWTDEPILAAGRFCNIYREHDRVTRWISANIVEPHHDDPDLWFALTLARCVNEPDALAELLPHLLPFNATRCREILLARQARGEKCFRSDAYKPPTPDRKGVGTVEFVIDEVLAPMWRDRENLRPRGDKWLSPSLESLSEYSERLEQCYRIGPFLAAQIIADLKHVPPLNAAEDWWTFARPGPGSERGLNRVRSRPVKASWSEAKWHRELMALHDETAELFANAGLAPLDNQNLQSVLCELDKWERARDAGGKPARRYKSAATIDKPAPKATEEPTAGNRFASVRKPTSAESRFGHAAKPTSTADPNEPPEYIREDIAQRADTAEEPKAAEPPPKDPPRGNGAGNSKSDYPRGERDTGREEAFYIYQDARGRNYSGVKRTSTKQFPQSHWDGTQWRSGAPRGPKLPFRLPELLDASPDAWVVIAAGEKDALTAAALGFIATTNPGGEGPKQWTADLNRWFTDKQRVAVMEDNDDTGKAHALEVATALQGVVPDIRIVGFHELKKGGDLTDWIEADRARGHAELLARIEATSTTHAELEEWDAGELLSGADPEPRQWLTARYFCRGFLSGLVAPGDAGKTTLRLTQAIELAAGRELLGARIYHRARVLMLCFEDDRPELHRRLKAICKHYNIDPAEFKGRLFCRNLKKIKLAELDSKGRRPQVGALDAMLRRAIERGHYDLVVLDPFVKLHALMENDNAAMDFVCELLIDIAQSYNIAVDCPAHTHKGAIIAGDADARRGASAQRDAGRLDYTLTVMSEAEAKQFGVSADERKGYVRLDKAKANIVRVMKAAWFRLISVRLDNATTLYPDGDEVQAIERWTPPETWAGIEGETLNTILDEIDAGLPNGQRYSRRGRATTRAAWQVVHKHCPAKAEAQCREIIKQWYEAKVLFEAEYDDPVSRKSERGLHVDDDNRPQY